MISMLFDKENEIMKDILNQRNLISNMIYKLMRDENCKIFFNDLYENIKNYDDMERMQKYYFERDFKEMFKTLNLFNAMLTNNSEIKNKSSEDIRKCCHTFSDHNGEYLLYILGHLPIMQLFEEKRQYESYTSEISDDKMVKEWDEERKDDLFNKKSIHYRKFPKEDKFISMSLKNEFKKSLKKDYEERKVEIDTAIGLLLEINNSSESKYETKIKTGCLFWDEKIKLKAESANKFKEIFTALSDKFDAESKEKLDKLGIILADEIKEKIDKEVEVSITETDTRKGKIKIESSERLNEEDITKISKIFVIKSRMELVDIGFIENKNDSYIFSCKLEL